MRILVTGVAGFLGSHLCEYLLFQGHTVVCFDNFSTGSILNLSNFKEHKEFSIIHGDVTSLQEIDGELNQIYNLACPASPVQYQKNPIATLKTNVLGAINVLQLAVTKDAQILQASTSEVYGDPEVHPQVEEYLGNVNTIGIRSCYDEGKRAAETAFFDYHRSEKLRIRVIRIFNTYGPRMDPNDGRVISNFIVQALKGEDLTIYGDGNQTRSFCYVDDLIRGIVLVMNAENIGPGPFNLGNPVDYKMLDLANKILVLTKSSSKISYFPLPQDDPKKRKPDISKVKEKIDWTPKTNLEDGLAKTISFFKSTIEIDLNISQT